MNRSNQTYSFYVFLNMFILVLLICMTTAEASMKEALSAARNRNFEQAYKLFLVEAELGNPEAQYRLANMLSAGSGVRKNEALALSWLNKSANLGHAKAINKLARSKSVSQPVRSPVVKLFKASRSGNIGTIKKLVEMEADVNSQDELGSTPLMEAIRENQNEAARYLLSQSANPNVRNKVGDTALLVATALNNSENVRLILEHGGNVNALDKHNSSSLIIAVSRENLQTTRSLIGHNADIFLTNDEGRSAYDIALSSKNKQLIKMIQQVGGEKLADLNRVEEEKQKRRLLLTNPSIQRDWSPLMYSAWRGDILAVKTSLNSNADLEQKDTAGMTALSLSASGGHVEVVEILLSAGSVLECKNNDVNPVLIAIRANHKLVVEALVSNLVEKNSCSIFLEKMLGQSLALERLSIATVFFKNGININHDEIKSPLITMASTIDEGLIRKLIKNGADVNSQGEHGETALMVASKSGNMEAVKTLIDLNAYINKKDDFGRSALIYSSIDNQPIIVNYLIEREADILSSTTENNSALMLAAEKGHLAVVELLTTFKNIDQKNNVGDTALIMAARGGHFDVSDVLLKQGANPGLSNNKKEKAITVVRAKDIKLHALIEEYASSRSWIKDIF